MRIGFAAQYQKPVIILEEGDTNPDEIIDMAEESDAVYFADDRYLVIRFLGRTDEVFTEQAVRRSFKKTPSASSS